MTLFRGPPPAVTIALLGLLTVSAARAQAPAAANARAFTPSLEFTALSRLGRWTGASFEPVGPQSVPPGRVIVLTHGWGIGSGASVAAYDGPPPARVWDPRIRDNVGRPAGWWMTQAALALTQRDPQATVLAYSWIDESATSDNILDAYLSQAYTDQNGYRLANALSAALAGNFAAAGGTVHLVGHSHGAKVATVAAHALVPPPVQVTLLDSPEESLSQTGIAANNLRFYLPLLPVGRQAGTVFVDNYYSQFGQPYHGWAGLADVVDVQLEPGQFSPLAFSARHNYPIRWYLEATTQRPDLGLGWSPAVGGPVQDLEPAYRQNWAPREGQPDTARELDLLGNPLQTLPQSPRLTPLDWTSLGQDGSVTLTAEGVTLDDAGGDARWFARFDQYSTDKALLMDINFLDAGQGDQVAIWVDDGLRYVLGGTVAGLNRPVQAVIGLTAAQIGPRQITIGLYRFGASKAVVRVTNLRVASELDNPVPLAPVLACAANCTPGFSGAMLAAAAALVFVRRRRWPRPQR